MTECDRCGGVHDGATMQETADGTYCLTCINWMEEHPGRSRDVDQNSLEDYDDR